MKSFHLLNRALCRPEYVLLIIAAAIAAACPSPRTAPTFKVTPARSVASSQALAEMGAVEDPDCAMGDDIARALLQSPLVRSPLPYWIDPNATLETPFAPTEVLLTDHPDGAMGDFVAVRARFPASVQLALTQFRKRFYDCEILVFVNEESSWIEANRSDWSREVPIGVFDRESKTLSALVNGNWDVRWTSWNELEAASRATAASRRRSLEMLACDADFRARFLEAHPGADDLLREELESIDCDNPGG